MVMPMTEGPKNLFLSTRALTGAKEDHLTEFFAAALSVSEPLRNRYFDLVLKPFATGKKWGSCSITSVNTQCGFDDTTCCPDMVLTLSNAKRIACEHKIEAIETPGPESGKNAGQLERYLRLPVHGLVYVRASRKPPEHHVLRHTKYVRPTSGEHFLWRDFYPLFENISDPVVAWLREGFERLGYTPPTQIGELDTDEQKRNFAKLWASTTSFAHGTGWEVSPGAIVQLYMSDNPSSSASEVFIQPVASRFQIRVTPLPGHQVKCFHALEVAARSLGYAVQGEETNVRRTAGKVAVYDVFASANDVLGRGKRLPNELEEKLYEFVAHFLNAIPKRDLKPRA